MTKIQNSERESWSKFCSQIEANSGYSLPADLSLADFDIESEQRHILTYMVGMPIKPVYRKDVESTLQAFVSLAMSSEAMACILISDAASSAGEDSWYFVVLNTDEYHMDADSIVRELTSNKIPYLYRWLDKLDIPVHAIIFKLTEVTKWNLNRMQ